MVLDKAKNHLMPCMVSKRDRNLASILWSIFDNILGAA
ncbi:hypothetical protein RCCS2_05789 [Roseobacter sp. CCS2]|nr:hypothetical protein RCCS2_05789 [Roseobacter sp. CCS2]